MFTNQFLSLLSLHPHPTQADDHQVPPRLFLRKWSYKCSALGVSNTGLGCDTVQWKEVEVSNSPSRQMWSRHPAFPARSQKVGRWAYATIPTSGKNSTVLGEKNLYILTMKELEFTLLWSPPAPFVHMEISVPHTNINGQRRSSGIWRKPYERQRPKQASR